MVGFGLGTVMLMAYGATLLIIGGTGKGRRMTPVSSPDTQVASVHDPGPEFPEKTGPAASDPAKSTPAPPPEKVHPTPAPAPVPRKVRPSPAPAPKPKKVRPRPTPAPAPRKTRPTPAPSPRPKKVRPTPAPAPVPKKVRPAPTPRSKPRPAPAADRHKEAQKLFRQGLQQLMRGNASAAIVQFNRSLEKNPRFAQAYRGMGLAYQKLGRKTMARAAFRRYLLLNPKARDAAAIRKRIEMLR